MKKLLAFFLLFFIYLETKSAEHQIVSFPPISEEPSDSGKGSSRSLTPTKSIGITPTYH